MRVGVVFELLQIGLDHLFPTILALYVLASVFCCERRAETLSAIRRFVLTRETGFGALTGRPFGLTGARVPAACHMSVTLSSDS